jgi:hypothetical protein
MSYDLGRLAADRKDLIRSMIVGADSFMMKVSERISIEVVRQHLGNASQFEWLIRDFESKKIARVIGLDLTGYWKTSLSKAAKAAGVILKQEIPSDWYTRPRSEFTDAEWDIFLEYGLGDVRSTLELYHATVALLRDIDDRVVKRTGVIPPSAPGAAARIVFQGAFDMHPELRKENGGPGSWMRAPQWADQLGCDSYYGGRVFCIEPGCHEGMASFDIKSAYSYAMACMPDPVGMIYESVNACDHFDINRFRGQFGALRFDGCGIDDIYPALRVHDVTEAKDGSKRYGRLRYLVGEFKNHAATIPEIVLGVLSGTLRVDRIREGVIMRGDPEKSFLRAGMAKFFGIKNDPTKEKALQDMAKLLGNSTYGKLVEVNARDYSVLESAHIPVFQQSEKVAKTIARIYASCGRLEFNNSDDDDSEYFGDTPNQVVRSKETFQRLLDTKKELNPLELAPHAILDYIASLVTADVPLEVDEHGKRSNRVELLANFMRSQTQFRCGQYFMPLIASNITGLIAGILGAGAKCVGALQGDTDSLHVPVPPGFILKKDKTARELELPGWREFDELLAKAGYGAPIESIPKLGQFFCEVDAPTKESILVRPKVYSHDLGDGDFKQAKHGVSKFPDSKAALHEACRSLLDQSTYTYDTKASPRKMREAIRTDSIIGEFVSHQVTLNFIMNPHTKLDENNTIHWLPLHPLRGG